MSGDVRKKVYREAEKDGYKEEYNDIFIDNHKIVFAKIFNKHRIYLSRVPKREVKVSGYLEFIYVIRGQVNIKTEIEERVLTEGNLHIISPDLVYKISHEYAENIILYLQCDPSEFNREYNLQGEHKIINNFDERVEEELASLIGNIYISSFDKNTSLENRGKKSLINLNKIMNIIYKLETVEFKEACNSNVDDLVIDIIKNLPRMVSGSYDTNLNAISEEYNISYSYLSRTFKRLTGENYTDYLQKIRMNRAVELLIHTDNKVLDISIYSGFTSMKTFNNVFKKTFNISPTQLREEYEKVDDIRSLSPLYLDIKTQKYLGQIYNNNIKSRKIDLDDKFSINSNTELMSISKGSKVTNVLDLEYLLNSYPSFSEITESVRYLDPEYLIIELIYADKELYILRDSGKLVRILDKDLNLLLNSMNENDIKPIIRINYKDIDVSKSPDEYKEFYKALQDKVRLMYYIIGFSRLNEYAFEIHIPNMIEHLRYSADINNLTEHVGKFREIINEGIEVTEPRVGMYFGEISEVEDLKAMNKLFEKIGPPRYIDIDIGFEIIMSSSLEYIVNLLDDITNYFKPAYGKIPIMLNFIYYIKNNELYKESTMIYNTLFTLKLQLYLQYYGYNLKESIFRYKGMNMKNYFTDKVGINLFNYYFYKFISSLEGEIIEIDKGIIVTKKDEDITAIIYEDYDIYFDNVFRTGLDSYINTTKNVLMKMDKVEGIYKMSEYSIMLDKIYDESEDVDRKLFLSITEDDKMLLQKKYLPTLKVNIVDFSNVNQLIVKKKPLDIVLIKLNRC